MICRLLALLEVIEVLQGARPLLSGDLLQDPLPEADRNGLVRKRLTVMFKKIKG